MSLSLAGNLSPLPVSTSRRRPPTSISKQRVVYSQRFWSSHDTSFDHSVFGTTPCMAPPSRRKLPPFTIVSFASPRIIILDLSCHGPASGAAGSLGAGGAGSGAATGEGAATVPPNGMLGGAGAAGAGGACAMTGAPLGLWMLIQSAT